MAITKWCIKTQIVVATWVATYVRMSVTAGSFLQWLLLLLTGPWLWWWQWKQSIMVIMITTVTRKTNISKMRRRRRGRTRRRNPRKTWVRDGHDDDDNEDTDGDDDDDCGDVCKIGGKYGEEGCHKHAAGQIWRWKCLSNESHILKQNSTTERVE